MLCFCNPVGPFECSRCRLLADAALMDGIGMQCRREVPQRKWWVLRLQRGHSLHQDSLSWPATCRW